MRRISVIALLSAAAPVTTAEPAVAAPGIEGVATTVLALMFILALIFGAAWLMKRVAHLPSGGKGLVRVLGGASVGTRERVVVVEVDDARLVLGVAPGRVETLHVLPAQSEFDSTLKRAGEGAE